MANGVYNKAKAEIAKNTIDLDGSTLKVMLVKSTYTFDPDHDFVDNGGANDPIDHEISVSGYSRQTLTTKVVTQDNTNDFAYLDADDTVFSALASGQTVGGAVLYRDAGGADSANPCIAFYDLTDTPTNGGNITVQWAAAASGAVLKLA
jgi:hypothetical protein